jgi:porin
MPTNTALLFPKGKNDVYAITSLVFTQFLNEHVGVSIGKFNTIDLYQRRDNPKVGWGLFGMVGGSDGNPSPVEIFVHGGVGGNSLIPGREEDNFGIGYYFVGVSDDLRDTVDFVVPLDDEQGVEIFYNLALTGWLHLAADVQIIDPFLARRDTATVFGIRGKIAF